MFRAAGGGVYERKVCKVFSLLVRGMFLRLGRDFDFVYISLFVFKWC